MGFAGISYGPYLQNVTLTGITVNVTSTGADATVEYGLDTGYGSSVYSDTPIVIGAGSDPLFELRVDGLSPGTVYHYRVTSGGETTADRAFTTAHTAGDPFRFVAYGDTRRGQIGPPAHQDIVNGIIAESPDFVLNTGDVVNFDELLGEPTTLEWDFWFETTTPLLSQSPMFCVRGNHDDGTNLFELFMDNPTAASGNELYYSFDYGNAHILALDSTLDVCSGAQLAFVEADLAAHAGNGPLFVFFHHPPFSNGSHGGNSGTHDCWAPLLQEYGVDIVFGGHDHLYTRYGPYPAGSSVPGINGVNYIVTGGGGAPLYAANNNGQPPIAYTLMSYNYMTLDISGDNIDVVTRNHLGAVLETFSLDASANDGLYDRTDPLPPKGNGGLCGTVPGQGKANTMAVGIYLLPAAFLLVLRRRVRNQA